MNAKELDENYYKELDVIREFENRNDTGRDSILMQLSVGLLAVLAAFGEKFISANKTLAYLSVISLGVTILLVIIGFLTTKEMLKAIRSKMKKNVLNGRAFYEGYTNTTWQGVNSLLNIGAFVTFLLGIAFFSSLLIIYIGEING